MTDSWTDLGTVAARPKPLPKPVAPESWADLGIRRGYATTPEFHADMDRALGKGGYRDTGDYRSLGREQQLRSEGAATVPAGAVSPHSRGTPEAPGAHDIVPVGDWRSAEDRLRKTPGVRDVVYEGAAGGQGPHLHVDMQQGEDWSDLGHTAPAPKPAPDPGAGPGGLANAAGVSGGDQNTYAGHLGGIVGSNLADIQRARAQDNPAIRDNPMFPTKAKAEQIGPEFNMLLSPVAALLAQHLQGKPTGPQEYTQDWYAEHGQQHPRNLEHQQNRITSQQAEDLGQDLSAYMPVGGIARGAGKAAEVVGGLAERLGPAKKTADALYRLQGAATADRIEAGDFIKRVPQSAWDADEAAYHAREARMAGVREPAPSGLDAGSMIGGPSRAERIGAVERLIEPYHQEETALINKIRASNNPDAEAFLEDSGYVHRIKKGGANLFEPAETSPRDPFRGRRSITKTTGSMKQRKFLVVEDPEGNVVTDEKGKPIFQPPDSTYQPGATIRGSDNKLYRVRHATTKEIEGAGVTDEATGQPLEYQKSLIKNTVDNVMRLRRVARNMDTLSATLDEMKARGVAHREEWMYRDADGKLQTGRGEQAPAGFASIHDIPQLKGWKFDVNDPQVQELRDFLPKHGKENWEDGLTRINNFMLRSNFLLPFVHPKNVAEFWALSRGSDWFNFAGYNSLARTMPRAMTEVLSMGPAYQRLLREGSALMSGESRAPELSKLLIDKGGQELLSDPKAFAAISRWAPFKSVADAYNAFQVASHKMMWAASDVMMMQRVLELEGKGRTTRDAIAEAEQMLPNYRVPAQIWKGDSGRMVGNLFRNNNVFALGRYHYNKLANAGGMFNRLLRPGASLAERQEAAAQFLVAGVIAAGVAPVLNGAVQLATGNKNAHVKAGGIMGLPAAASDVAAGREGMQQAVASILDFNPVMDKAIDVIRGRDWRGQPVIDPMASTKGKVVQGAEEIGSAFGPFNMAQEALNPKYGPARMALSQFGIDAPQTPRGSMKGSTRRYLQRQAKSREKNDPLERAIP